MQPSLVRCVVSLVTCFCCPWSYSRRHRRRSLRLEPQSPTSPWANTASKSFDHPGQRLWWGPRWRAIHGRGREYGRAPWSHSKSLSQRERHVGHHAASLLCVVCDSLRSRGGGPPIEYGSSCLSMCQYTVVIRLMTATRAIFEPRRSLIRRYQAFILGSCLRK